MELNFFFFCHVGVRESNGQIDTCGATETE